MTHVHRHANSFWGIFPAKRGGITRRVDVAPVTETRRLLAGHQLGANCPCKPLSQCEDGEIPW